MDIDGLFFRLGAKFDATFSQTMSEAERRFAQVGDAMQSAGASMEMLFTRPIMDAAGAALKLGSDFQQTTIGFTTLLGSADKASEMLNNLKQFAAQTPFEFPGLVDASKRMLAFGFEAEKIIPTLRTIGDAAAGLGGGAKSIDLITLALGQMSAKGKVSAQEMNQIAEQGVSAWKALAANIGVSIPEAMKLAEKGAIDAATAIPAILKGMDDQFGGMMAKQAETVAGQWSNLKDQLTFILYDLGAALLPFAQAAISALAPIGAGIKTAVEYFGQLSPPIQTALVVMTGLAAAIGPVLVSLGMLASAVVSISSAFAVIGGTAGVMAGVVAGLKMLAVAAAAGAAAFAAWKIGSWLVQFGPVKAVIDAVGAAIGGMLSWIAKLPGISSVVGAMSSAWDSLKGGIERASASVANAGKTFQAQGPTLTQLGISAEKTAPSLAKVGVAMDASAKQAAAAAKQMEAHLATMWKSLSGFLLDMPKTFEAASKMMAQGFNIDSAIKSTIDKMQALQIEFGTKMPAAAQQMYAALNINLIQLKAFRDQADQLRLDQAFIKANEAITAYGTNAARILKDQAAMTKTVMDISMASATQAIADVQRLDGAFRQLGVTWSGELTSKATKAAEAFELIVAAQKKGEASATDMMRAQVKMLEAQIAAAKASGDSWQQYESTLKGVQAALKASGVEAEASAAKHTSAGKQAVGAASEMQKSLNSFGQQVSTVMTDFSKNLATSILQAKNFGDAFIKAAQAIKEAFLRMVVEGAIKQMMSGLGDVSKMLGGLGQQMNGLLGSIFGGGGSSGGGSGTGGGGGGAGGGGGLGGMLGGSNPISMMSGITSMITGVLQTLQGRRMEADIGKIEVTSRGQLNQLISIQATMNKYLPLLDHNVQLMRLEGIEQALAGGGGNMMADLVAALSQALQGVSQTLQQGFQMLAQRLDLLTETMRINLRGLIDITSTAYSMLLKPGSTPQYNLTTQNGRPNAAPPVTLNQTILAQTNDPYRLGVQSVQGMQAAMGFRL